MPRKPEEPKPRSSKENIPKRRAATERPRKINDLKRLTLGLDLQRTYGKGSTLCNAYYALATTPGLIEAKEAFARTLQDSQKRKDMLAILKTAREYRESILD